MSNEAKSPPGCLNDIFPEISPDLIDVLEQMLQFNPYFRPTAKEMMKHPLFKGIRLKEEE